MKAKVVIHFAGANKVRNSPELQQSMLGMVQDIAASGNQQAGLDGDDSYVADVQAGPNRATAMVKTSGIRSRRDNAINQRILRNVDRGRR